VLQQQQQQSSNNNKMHPSRSSVRKNTGKNPKKSRALTWLAAVPKTAGFTLTSEIGPKPTPWNMGS
jgi:hypothetical protein